MAKQNYVIFNPEGGLGKIIASTAIIKYIEKKYPDHKIIIVCPWAEVYLNNPRIERVFKSFNTPYFYKDYIQDRDSIVLKGEPYFQPKHMYQSQHLIKSWCDLFNLEFDGKIEPELYFNSVEREEYAGNIATQFKKPVLLFQTSGGPYEDEKSYCWTRDFPIGQAQILTDELCKTFDIVQVGKKNGKRLNNATFIDDVQSKRMLMSLVLRSSKRILIDSCLQHAAAAFGLSSTVCWVGTSPKVFGYDIHTNILPNAEKLDIPALMPDAQFFDNDFNGPEHDYPYADNNIFNLQSIFDSVMKTNETNTPQSMKESRKP